ncbi:ABC transporter substrate-binding protein [Consotaella salsifontis]|uniref:Spermidine/putrescine transport system substrate-binding protein n=1 Tax=Consotaella salsifontis TaxID=1365950 RepID=A0A1T4PKE3_9HYPH|nr:ABC transporter substrate-binding protein [Consotaella salsifontis]SJZ91972.1 spermidine/putrescine transport system substrate-binding protein [Consotaella salsifontis]
MKRLLLAATLALAAQTAHADEIRVLNWQGYGTDIDWAVKEFAEKTGNTVVHEYFTSEQEMLTKLRTNPGAYDVVLVNSAYTAQAADEGLIAPIDTAKIKNFSDLDPKLTGTEALNPKGKLFGVPWTWGLTALAVNTNDFPEPPTSLSVLWDPQWKGRVSIRDDGLEAVQFGALALGQDMDNITDLSAIKAKLAELMPQITTFWSSENEWNQAMASGEFAVATYWSGSAARSISKGLPIAFVVPKEGAVGWLDSLAVPAASKHKDAAHAFIDWMVDPAFYVKWDAEGAPVSSNTKAIAALPDDSFNKKLVADPATVSRVHFFKPVSDADRETYLKLWQDLKAAQ